VNGGTVVHLPRPARELSPGGFDIRHPSLVAVAALLFGGVVVGAAAGRGVLAGLVAVLAVAATLWAVSHPTTGAIAVVAIVPAISGLQRGLPVPGLRLGELLAAGFGVMLLATAGRDQWRRWRTFDWLALVYVVATFGLGLLASEIRGDSLSSDDLGQLLGPLQFFLLYRAVLVALPRRDDRLRALDWLLLGSLPVSALALMQILRVPGVEELLVTLTGEDFSDRRSWAVTRANGPFPHWTMLAGYLFALVLIASALLLSGVEGRRRRIALVSLAASSLALVATLTLGPILGALAGAIALAVWYRRSGRMLAWTALACVILLVLFQPLLSRRADDQFRAQASSSADYSLVPQTVSNRIGFWTDQYLPALQGRWLTGYGPQIPPEITWKYTESVYITMLLRGGLPLLLVYLALSAALALMALDVARRPLDPRAGPERAEGPAAERALARAVFVIVLILAVLQLIAPFFTTTGLPHVWWLVAASVAGAAYTRGR
jgi:O-Antigen ligase